MEEINIQKDAFPDEIGSIAKILDSEMTVLERMKITRHNLIRISSAILFYLIMMLIFTALL